MAKIRVTVAAMLAGVLTVGCTSGDAKTGAPAGAVADAPSRAQAASGDGFRFTYTSTMQADGMGAAAAQATGQEITGSARVRGGKARMDFATDAGPMMKKGSYMLMDAATSKMTIVNVAEGTGMVIDGAQMAGMLEGMPGMKMTLADVSSRTEELGPGETMLGYATKKYRVTNAYTMNMAIMGRTISTRNESVTTLDVSDEIAGLDPAFQRFSENFASSLKGLPGDAMKQIVALNRNLPKGFALAQEQVNTSVTAGKTITVRTRMRLTEFARGGVDEADLIAPTGLKITDMGAMLREGMSKAKSATQGVPAPRQ